MKFNAMTQSNRRGVAAVEFAVVMALVLMPTMMGVWEVGRLVQVQQIVSNSAREGARLASQAVTISPTGVRTEIRQTVGSPNIRRTVYEYLVLNGLSGLAETDVNVEFKFTTGALAGSTTSDPYQGKKGDKYTVKVTIPWNKVRWINFGFVSSTSVSFTVAWTMLVDEPFTIDPTITNW
jgi:Flp pilus assembly protein TadG